MRERSACGDVTGEKHHLGLPGGAAACDDEFDFANINAENMCYRAEFSDGNADETGESILTLSLVFGDPNSGAFNEEFFPDPTISCGGACPDDEDEDGDGLIDSQESRFFTVLGNDDSDFDGIADGNNDANGNGEDDEDEDEDDDEDDD